MGKIRVVLLVLACSVSAFAFTITDVLDRKIELEKPAKKVIGLGTSLSYITYLNSVDKVIGIESIELKDIKKRTYTYVNNEVVKNLPIIGQGGKAKRPNLEAIITLRPDVVFTITQDKSEADLLQKQLNIPVVVVGYGRSNVEFKTIYHSLEIMGKILDKEQRADELISYMKELQNEFKEITPKKEAFIGAVAYRGLQGITSTQVDFIPFAIAKVDNVTSNLQDKGHLFINKEYLLVTNPKTIFIDNAGWELVQEEFKKNQEYYKKLKAFENNSYLILANTFYFINIDQMLANSFFIAKTIYPDTYKDLDPEKKADEIFMNFVGKPLYKMLQEDTGGFKKIDLKNGQLKLKSIDK